MPRYILVEIIYYSIQYRQTCVCVCVISVFQGISWSFFFILIRRISLIESMGVIAMNLHYFRACTMSSKMCFKYKT